MKHLLTINAALLALAAASPARADIVIVNPDEVPVMVNTYAVINEGSDTIAVNGIAVANGDTLAVRGYAVLEPMQSAKAAAPATPAAIAPAPVDTATVTTDMPQIRRTALPTAIKRQRKAPQPDPFETNGILGHFTWGIDLGSGVDCSAHDMTMLHFGAAIGYKNKWLRFAGAGVDIVSMMNNQSRCYPVYAMVRTSFSSYYQTCFGEVKSGVSYNSISGYQTRSDFYGSVGVGVTLAHSRVFSSHIVLRYTAMPIGTLSYKTPEGETLTTPGYLISYACIGIGCYF